LKRYVQNINLNAILYILRISLWLNDIAGVAGKFIDNFIDKFINKLIDKS